MLGTGKPIQVYPDGFYVHARPRMRSAKGCARYIGRYLARPAVAEYRIEYSGAFCATSPVIGSQLEFV